MKRNDKAGQEEENRGVGCIYQDKIIIGNVAMM